MTTAAESTATLFEETFDSLRKATESALQTQQEMYGKWAKIWPGMAMPQNDLTARARKFQTDWSGTITEMMQKHRELIDQQYRTGIESLEEAFRVAALDNPEELREGCEALCRKTLDLMKAASEKQMQQFQEAMEKWVEACQMKP